MNVHQAFAAAMAEVTVIAKKDRNEQQRFMFRGIDAVLDEVGPALRRHGVFIVPTAKSMATETYSTKSGTTMRNVTVTMKYTVRGPEGDSFTGSAFGEAADSGDKAVTKAQSVAYRTFLLQSMAVPTGEPDPDASSHERAAAAAPRRRPLPAQTPADVARVALQQVCKDGGLELSKIGERFTKEHGMKIMQADEDTIKAFTKLIADEVAVDKAAAQAEPQA